MVIRIESETERSRRMGQNVHKDHVAKALEDLDRLRVLKEHPQKWDDDYVPPKRDMVERKIEKQEKPPVQVQEKIEVVRSAKKERAGTKELISIRLEPDVLEYFRGTGPGWQGRINSILSDYARKKG